MRALLNVGHLRTEVRAAFVPVLHLPDSDLTRREWFDCVQSTGKVPRRLSMHRNLLIDDDWFGFQIHLDARGNQRRAQLVDSKAKIASNKP